MVWADIASTLMSPVRPRNGGRHLGCTRGGGDGIERIFVIHQCLIVVAAAAPVADTVQCYGDTDADADTGRAATDGNGHRADGCGDGRGAIGLDGRVAERGDARIDDGCDNVASDAVACGRAGPADGDTGGEAEADGD